MEKNEKKMWLLCKTIYVRPLAMEKQWKNRGTMMKKWRKIMKNILEKLRL